MARIKKNGCPYCGQGHDPDVMVCPMTGMSLRFSDPEKAVGQVIGGKYRLTRLIGKGGMGSVYEAVNIQLDKKVAIKLLLPESSNIDQIAERFKREARSAASIGHENIVDVYDLDVTEEGTVYIVMELLMGQDLAQALQSCGSIPLHRAARIGVQTARALGAAHERGIIHRDLKPENIFLLQRKSGETVKIVDFGIAMIKEHGRLSRLTTDGILLGTPYYMSPEQARGVKDLDHRVDIYALGAVLFEALTGKVLFSGETYLEVISKHQMEQPPTLQERKPDLLVPVQVQGMISRMLEKDPSRRPSSMEVVEKALLPYTDEWAGQGAMLEERAVEFAETIADAGLSTGRIETSAEGTHTTPIGWDEKWKSSKLLSWRLFVAVAGLVAIFAASALVAILVVSEKQGGKPSASSGSFPISFGREREAAEKERKLVSVKVAAFPGNALIKIDGRDAGGNPVHIDLPRSTRKAAITVEAEGYRTDSREIMLDRDHDLVVSLEKSSQPKEPKKEKKKKEEGGIEPKPAVGKHGITAIPESPYKK